LTIYEQISVFTLKCDGLVFNVAVRMHIKRAVCSDQTYKHWGC